MNKKLKILLCDADYIFLNYIIANIPCWHIRKVFYCLHGMKLGKKEESTLEEAFMRHGK